MVGRDAATMWTLTMASCATNRQGRLVLTPVTSRMSAAWGKTYGWQDTEETAAWLQLFGCVDDAMGEARSSCEAVRTCQKQEIWGQRFARLVYVGNRVRGAGKQQHWRFELLQQVGAQAPSWQIKCVCVKQTIRHLHVGSNSRLCLERRSGKCLGVDNEADHYNSCIRALGRGPEHVLQRAASMQPRLQRYNSSATDMLEEVTCWGRCLS